MSRRREQRIRRKARAQLRTFEREMAKVGELQPVALAAIAYVDEMAYPNIKEPWSIWGKRDELVAAVRSLRARRARHARRPAPDRRAA